MVNVRNEQDDESKESSENEAGKKSKNRAGNEHKEKEGEENEEGVGRTTISARGVRGMKRAEKRQKNEKRTGREEELRDQCSDSQSELSRQTPVVSCSFSD